MRRSRPAVIRQRLLAVCISLLVLGPAAAVELERLGDDPLRTGELVEWTLRGELPLTTDCARLPVLEVARGDERVRRAAFLYQAFTVIDGRHDGREYRPADGRSIHLRHVFREPGEYRLRLLDGERVLHEDTVAVAAGSRPRGPIGISAENPRLLAWADGTPFVTIGCNVAWAARPDRLRRMLHYLDRVAAAGGNHVRVWCASWSGQIEGDAPDAYRLDQAWMLDRVLQAAQVRGIAVTLVLDNHHDFALGAKVPYGDSLAERQRRFFTAELSEQYRRRLAYLVARYGAYDSLMAWELFNEIDLALLDQGPQVADPAGRAASWAGAAAEALAALDPDRHLITISLAREDWPQLWAQPAIDLVHVHRYVPRPEARLPSDHDGVGLLEAALPSVRAIGKPFCFAEVGHHGVHGDVPGIAEDPQGVLVQQLAWSGLLLGGHGTGMNWWWDEHLEANDLWSTYTPIATAVAAIDWRDPELQPLDPNRGSRLRVMGWRSRDQAILWPQARADTWYALAVEGQPPTRFRVRPPALILPGLAPATRFRLSAIAIDDGRTHDLGDQTSDAEGRLRLQLGADAGRMVFVIRRDEE